MDKLKENKEIVKLEKAIGDSSTSHFRGLTKSELEFKLLELAKHREELVTTEKEDEELQRAKDLIKELKAPYAEQNKHNKLKCRFIHLLIKEKSCEA